MLVSIMLLGLYTNATWVEKLSFFNMVGKNMFIVLLSWWMFRESPATSDDYLTTCAEKNLRQGLIYVFSEEPEAQDNEVSLRTEICALRC